jgi:hypothetical protein
VRFAPYAIQEPRQDIPRKESEKEQVGFTGTGLSKVGISFPFDKAHQPLKLPVPHKEPVGEFE